MRSTTPICHYAGDDLLNHVASMLLGLVRQTDVVRDWGRRVLLLLRSVDVRAGARSRPQFLPRASTLVPVGRRMITASTSVGIAIV